MKFLITMNMPSKAGREIHSMIVEHPAKSLEEFVEEFEDREFLVVDEFYVDSSSGSRIPEYRGPVGVSYRHIGKIKEYKVR